MGGIVFGLRLPDQPGSVKELEDIIRPTGAYCEYSDFVRTRCQGLSKGPYRVRRVDRNRLPQLKEALEKKASLLYLVDSRQGTREIYETKAD